MRIGATLNCLVVIVASSRAIIRPKIDTARAVSFNTGGMVIIGVFAGVMFEVMRRPATILPQASRLIGLITVRLFSLIGARVMNRGWPIDTKKMTRRL